MRRPLSGLAGESAWTALPVASLLRGYLIARTGRRIEGGAWPQRLATVARIEPAGPAFGGPMTGSAKSGNSLAAAPPTRISPLAQSVVWRIKIGRAHV